jgi:hypothetical protein
VSPQLNHLPVTVSVSGILGVVFWDNGFMSAQRQPSGLRAPGKRLWSAVVESFVLNAAEVAMLEQACRTADELDRLERAVRALPELTSTGSTSQVNRIRCWRRCVLTGCCWSGLPRL